jgi:putative hydrolase of HD superfamily
MNIELEKTLEFVLELEKLKAVNRKIKPVGLDRYENSAEHSWQISVFALVLANFSNGAINREKVLKMLLIHDICEIDSDDVFFFDDQGRADAKNKELKSMNRILGMLPPEAGNDLMETWQEFENGDSTEAKFARAVDRAMPILQNLNNNKQSWIENNVTKEQILEKTAYIGEGSRALWDSIALQIEEAFE